MATDILHVYIYLYVYVYVNRRPNLILGPNLILRPRVGPGPGGIRARTLAGRDLQHLLEGLKGFLKPGDDLLAT